MIHTLLNLTRPLIVFDTETTGVDTSNDRIVEFGFQIWTAEGMTKEWRSLVNPMIPIPPHVTEVHGITDSMVNLCRDCQLLKEQHTIDTDGRFLESNLYISNNCERFNPWPRFKDMAHNIAIGFKDCDFAGKNIRFDLRITAAEMQREGVEWSYAGARIIDAERLEQLAVPRTLSHLHEKYMGEKHDGAHGALSDVRASVSVICQQLITHETLPRDVEALHALQWPGQCDTEGKFRYSSDGSLICMFGAHKNKTIQSIPPNYWRFILRENFSLEIKAIATNALKGTYPTRREV